MTHQVSSLVPFSIGWWTRTAVAAVVVAVLVPVGAATAQEDSPPDQLESWKQRHTQEGTTPEGALKVWFDAVFLSLDEETRDLGRELLQYLTIPHKDDNQWYRKPSSRTFVSRLEDPAYHHIFRSYAQGATPENGYACDPADYRLRIEGSAKDEHGRGWRLLLVSSGADTPRPVYLRQSTTSGLWYVDSFANVYVGIRPPQEQGAETFR